jgi:hypothetical protein
MSCNIQLKSLPLSPEISRIDTLFLRRQDFLNALPDRSAFVLFHVDKICLSREMAINLQRLGSEISATSS